MPDDSAAARALGEALASAILWRIKQHEESSRLLAETLAPSRSAEADDYRFAGELGCLCAFIATYAVNQEFAARPRYKSQVLREFHAQYLQPLQEEDRSAVKDRFARYETALRTRRPHEREDDILAKAFAGVCERTEYDFCSVASDLVAQELIFITGIIRRS